MIQSEARTTYADGMKRSHVRRRLLLGAGLALTLLVALWETKTPGAIGSSVGIPPFLSSVLPTGQRFELDAAIVERIDAGPYVYFCVRDDQGALHWIASLAATSPAAGGRVHVQVFASATHFDS